MSEKPARADSRSPDRWLCPESAGLGSGEVFWSRPAFVVECALSFHSVRAGFQYPLEQIFAAWYPARDLPIDWGTAAIEIKSVDEMKDTAPLHFSKPELDIVVSDAQYDLFQDELVDYLTRTRRFSVLENREYGMYSMPGESRESFLNRVAERAIERLEPEVKQLLYMFERQIEQVRERYQGRGVVVEDPEEHLAQLRIMFLGSETRLADLFLSRFRLVVSLPDQRENTDGDEEIFHELVHIEEEAKKQLNERYTECLRLISQCDPFEVGLQPGHIRVLRRGVVWVPLAGARAKL